MGEPGETDVQRALRLAAERAGRLAELDVAHCIIQRHSSIPTPPEQLPWGIALSTSYL